MNIENVRNLAAAAAETIRARNEAKSLPRHIASSFVSCILDVCPNVKLPALLELEETQRIMSESSVSKSILADELKRARRTRKTKADQKKVSVPRRKRNHPKQAAIHAAPVSQLPRQTAGQLSMPGLVPNGPISEL